MMIRAFSELITTDFTDYSGGPGVSIMDVKNWQGQVEVGRISSNEYIRKIVFDIPGLQIFNIDEYFTADDIMYGALKGPVLKIRDKYYWVLVNEIGQLFSYENNGAVPIDANDGWGIGWVSTSSIGSILSKVDTGEVRYFSLD